MGMKTEFKMEWWWT